MINLFWTSFLNLMKSDAKAMPYIIIIIIIIIIRYHINAGYLKLYTGDKPRF
jgi:hypothetical protein